MPVTISISDTFDGGNIKFVAQRPNANDAAVMDVVVHIQPDVYTELEKISHMQYFAFRVTLGDITVLHMGDADTRDEHFAIDGERWAARHIDAALPPYWYFTSEKGLAVLEGRLKPGMAVGVHVPIKLDPRYSDGLDEVDLFRQPGETRSISDSGE